jgi:large subunit ribosomal protein L25
MKSYAINARTRTEKGTRACRRLRAGGEVPASLYGLRGEQHESLPIAVSAYDITQAIGRLSTVLDVKLDGTRTELVHLSEVQRSTFGDDVVHVDLHIIDANKPMHGEVPLVFKGEAKGVREGGKLSVELHEIEVEALPRQMPREITVRVDDLVLNQALHVSDLQLPEGVKVLTAGSVVVAHVLEIVEAAEPEAAAAEAGAAEPEVISKGKKEEGEEAAE